MSEKQTDRQSYFRDNEKKEFNLFKRDCTDKEIIVGLVLVSESNREQS